MPDVIIRKPELKQEPMTSCPAPSFIKPASQPGGPPQIELLIRDKSRLERNCIFRLFLNTNYHSIETDMATMLLAKEALKRSLALVEKAILQHGA
jgi:hypothetical protein